MINSSEQPAASVPHEIQQAGAKLAEKVLQRYRLELHAPGTRTIVYAEKYLWCVVEEAARHLNAAGWAVEYGTAWTGKQLDRRKQGIAIQTREAYTKRRVDEVGFGYSISAALGCLLALVFGSALWCTERSQPEFVFFAVGVAVSVILIGAWAWSLSKRKQWQERVLESLGGEWHPINTHIHVIYKAWEL